MKPEKACRRCGSNISDQPGRCSRCGALQGFLSAGSALPVTLAIVILLLSAIIFWKFASRIGRGEKKDSRIALTFEPSPRGTPVLDLAGTMSMEYHDLGASVEIRIASPGMPIIYADTNRNGRIDDQGEDLSFAAGPDGSICVRRLAATENTACGEIPTSATAVVDGRPGDWKITFKIPKAELSTRTEDAQIAIEIFDEQTQRGQFYPAAPFARIYDLRFVPHSPRPTEDIRAASESPAVAPSQISPEKAPATPRQGVSATALTSLAPENHARKAVPMPPSIEEFEAGSEAIERGSGAVLHWKVSNSTRVRMEPETGPEPLPPQGSRTVYPNENSSYKLIAEGSGGTRSSQVRIQVTPANPPVISAFHADSATIDKGDSTTLRWAVARAANVKIDPGWDSLPSQGEVRVSPEHTTRYTLSANNAGTAVSDELTVIVASSRPVISLEAQPASVISGHSTTLRWKVSGATRVSIDPDLGAQSGEGYSTIRPLRTTQYTLSATGPGGTSTRMLTVPVVPAPPSAGELVWKGTIHGVQLLTIDKDKAAFGSLEGSLPGVPCIVQPVNEKRVSVAAAPSPRNNFERLVLRINGTGPMTVVVRWSLQ